MTVMGQHTIDETKDLIAVLNGRIFDLSKAYQNATLDPNVIAKDPSLGTDFPAFLNRWTPGILNIQKILDTFSAANPTIPDSILTSEPQFQQVLKLTNPQLPGPYTDKDLMGLQIRLQKITNIPWVDRPIPQSFDLDLSTYQVSDSAKKGVESAGKGVVGALGEAVANNWKPLAIGGVIVLAGAYGARRLHLI